MVFCFSGFGNAEDDVAAEGALYLHCFRASQGMSLNQSSEAKLPERILSMSMLLVLDRPFDVAVSPHSKGVVGVIQRQGKGLFATLTGRFGTSSHRYEGKINLDEVFDPAIQGFTGAVKPFRCVVSTNKDIGLFLKVQAGIDAERMKKIAEDGADQPATAPESKPEGEENPKLESEGRFQ